LTRFWHVRTRSDGPLSYIGGVSSLALSQSTTDGPGGGLLFTANGRQGGILGRDPNQSLAVTDSLPQSAPIGRAGVAELQCVTLGGKTALLNFGAAPGLQGHWLTADGHLGTGFSLPITASGPIIALETLSLGAGRDMIFVSSLQSLGVTAWLRGANGSMTQMQQLVGVNAGQGYDIMAMQAVRVGGQQLLLTVAAQGNMISSYRLDAAGHATLAATLEPLNGLAVSAPNLIKTVHINATATAPARDFALLGAAGSGSITVLELAANGSMQPIDQINDDLNTRFQGISVLECVTLQGRIFIVAGGADDGLTLLELLPNGRLLHLETIVDSLGIALQDVSAVSLRANGDRIDLFVTGWSETSISQFSIDPGPVTTRLTASNSGGELRAGEKDDLLQGGAANDTLYGNAGDDILIDGAGRDMLFGGGGADTFVFTLDGFRDSIGDFSPGVDRFDFSALAPIINRDTMKFIAMEGGIQLRLGEERFYIYSSNGQPIRADQLSNGDLFGQPHAPIIPLEVLDQELIGTDLADILIGNSGNDTLIGFAGADRLQGRAGNDLLIGESQDEIYDPLAAQVYRLYDAILGHAPDEAGHILNTNHLLAHTATLRQVATGLLNSPEYQLRFGASSNATFVTTLYQNILGHGPDSSSLNAWVTALASGAKTRAEVVVNLCETVEFVQATTAGSFGVSRAGHLADWTDDVFRLYQSTLDRAPDVPGMIYWATNLASGRSFVDVVLGFVNSREFQARYGATSDAAFVTLLYNNVLDRAPDAQGFAAWTRALSNHALTRAEVVRGFSQSPEFINTTATNLLTFMRSKVGDDRLDGGAGENLLFGGFGADTFVFDKSTPSLQRVTDLERWDMIELNGFGYTSAAQARLHMTQQGSDVVFADQGTRIIFSDVSLVQIRLDMFDI
jgi:Ca2+-binding RTX toxin-like protein